MSREIKFRAKDKDGCWRYGNLATGIYKGGWCPVIQEEYEDESLPIMESLKEYWIINNKTIGQYTGLNDKKGEEIYEGDILKQTNSFTTKIGVVIFKDGEYMIKVKTIHYDKTISYSYYNLKSKEDYNDGKCSFTMEVEYEVIGNVYDNNKSLNKDFINDNKNIKISNEGCVIKTLKDIVDETKDVIE